MISNSIKFLTCSFFLAHLMMATDLFAKIPRMSRRKHFNSKFGFKSF